MLLRESEGAGENVQVEFGIVEHEGAFGLGRLFAGGFARIVPEINEPLLCGVEVKVSTLAGRVRETDIVGMAERDVIAFRDASIFCCGGEAKPNNVALHRVEAVGFCVDADFCGCIEFLFHLYEGFFVVDADVGGRDVGGEACLLDGFVFAGFVARIAGVAIVFADESRFARDVFEQANQTVDFVFPKNTFERIAVETAKFKGVEVAVVGALCL